MAEQIVAAADVPGSASEIAGRIAADHRESTFRRGLRAAVATGRLRRSGRGSHLRYVAA